MRASRSSRPPPVRRASEVRRRRCRCDGTQHGARRARVLPRRGHPQAQGRHQRRDARASARFPDASFRPRLPSRASPAWRAASRWRAAIARWSSSCTRISHWSRPISCSTRSARHATCSAARRRCRWCCATKVAIGTGYGAQHSMDPAGLYAMWPGWRIVAPSTPFDYVGLMNSALRCEDPVLVIEHVALYNTNGPGPLEDLDYCIPLGKAKVVRQGGGVHRAHLSGDDRAGAAGGAGDGTRRRSHRPALARPRRHRLGDRSRRACARPTT